MVIPLSERFVPGDGERLVFEVDGERGPWWPMHLASAGTGPRSAFPPLDVAIDVLQEIPGIRIPADGA